MNVGLNPFGFTVWLLSHNLHLGKGCYGGKPHLVYGLALKPQLSFFGKAVCNKGEKPFLIYGLTQFPILGKWCVSGGKPFVLYGLALEPQPSIFKKGEFKTVKTPLALRYGS